MKSGFCYSGDCVDMTDFIFMFLGLDMVCTLWDIVVHYIRLYCLERLCIPDMVTGINMGFFLICNYTCSVNGPTGATPRLSSVYAPGGAPQLWGSATSHH